MEGLRGPPVRRVLSASGLVRLVLVSVRRLGGVERWWTLDPATQCTPGSLQGVYRDGGRVHTPSRVAPLVGRHQLHPQGSSTYLLTPWPHQA